MDEWVICYKKKKTIFRVHSVKTLPAAHKKKKQNKTKQNKNKFQ